MPDCGYLVADRNRRHHDHVRFRMPLIRNRDQRLLPFFGVKPVILNENGELVYGEGSGILAITEPWPGQMRTVFRRS